ncbi:hypothetical protein NL676_037184 [Syzygium grande]|nr:hypothetical protein NL676_037184 [Syzygium grande]
MLTLTLTPMPTAETETSEGVSHLNWRKHSVVTKHHVIVLRDDDVEQWKEALLHIRIEWNLKVVNAPMASDRC